MKNKLSRIGILSLLVIFGTFYLLANHFLANKKDNQTNVEIDNQKIISIDNNQESSAIVSNLYTGVRTLYDVINNSFKVNQDDIIVIGDITYKKIINFDDVMDKYFTTNGKEKYLSDLSGYFAYTDNGYYLAGNLVSYQTYYFRGNDTKIFITDYSGEEINGIIYEKWTSNNKNTLATIRVVKSNNEWLIDNISILATE